MNYFCAGSFFIAYFKMDFHYFPLQPELETTRSPLYLESLPLLKGS